MNASGLLRFLSRARASRLPAPGPRFRRPGPGGARLDAALDAGSDLEIVFRARDGAVTRRHVTPYGRDGAGRVVAHCHLREATRSFPQWRIGAFRVLAPADGCPTCQALQALGAATPAARSESAWTALDG